MPTRRFLIACKQGAFEFGAPCMRAGQSEFDQSNPPILKKVDRKAPGIDTGGKFILKRANQLRVSWRRMLSRRMTSSPCIMIF